MTQIQIKYFLRTAELLNFTEAAKACSISQPTLSKHIQLLEKDLGFSLFDRDTNSVVLTQAGTVMYKYWKNETNQLMDTVDLARSMSTYDDSVLKIGVITGWDIRKIGKLYDAIRTYDRTKENVEIICGQADDMMRMFDRGKIDFAVVTQDAKVKYDENSNGAMDKLKFYPLVDSKAVIVCASDSELTERNIHEQIQKETVFSADSIVDGSHLKWVTKVLEDHDLRPARYKETLSTHTMDIAVEYGLGVLVHPDVIAISSRPNFKAISIDDSHFVIYGMYLEENIQAQKLVKMLAAGDAYYEPLNDKN